ncbi:photosystem II protein PsbQ [Crocosphaera sp. UHCC 0190]|uniref:photosystem II protein PsbQ n=1 Tax=Crocosphaera sp. UHCC 0190 TaxID=3110246 RepID=UPI002B20D098|nr:photosystem II protein PsbQ [Crocosphaera sp. UHCC 0190]MEA5510285.1 photosystem II protein PsbQ [Crocosphaera sp. UHCC 0190]
MPRLRSILSLLLVAVAIFCVSCSGPQAKIPTTYSPEKIEQLQVLIEPIQEARENMSVLKEFISEQNWIDTLTYIHGPLGGLRREMSNLTRDLLPKDQKQAKQLSQDLFSDFERLDTAAKARNNTDAQRQYRDAVNHFDAFLDLLPKAS